MWVEYLDRMNSWSFLNMDHGVCLFVHSNGLVAYTPQTYRWTQENIKEEKKGKNVAYFCAEKKMLALSLYIEETEWTQNNSNQTRWTRSLMVIYLLYISTHKMWLAAIREFKRQPADAHTQAHNWLIFVIKKIKIQYWVYTLTKRRHIIKKIHGHFRHATNDSRSMIAYGMFVGHRCVRSYHLTIFGDLESFGQNRFVCVFFICLTGEKKQRLLKWQPNQNKLQRQ